MALTPPAIHSSPALSAVVAAFVNLALAFRRAASANQPQLPATSLGNEDC